MSIGALLASPEADGLFARAIAQSGAAHHATTVDDAARVASRFCEVLGVSENDAAGLCAATPERILEASVACEREAENRTVRARRPFIAAYSPVIDGQFLRDLPIRAIRAGDGPRVPVLAGTTADEYRLFAPWWPSTVTDAELPGLFGEQVVDGTVASDSYRAALTSRGEPGHASSVWMAALTDISFRVPADRLLEATARAGRPAFGYVFDWKSPANGGPLGACHSLDVFFMSGTYRLTPEFAGHGPAADALAQTMMDAWVAFARSGDPSTPGLHWPQFEPVDRPLMVLGEHCHTVTNYREAERSVWDGVIP